MAFDEVEILEPSASANKTGVSVGLVKIKSARANLRLTFRSDVFQTMGFSVSDRFKLLLGSGDDHGVIRLRKDRSGTLRVTERTFTGGVCAFQINLRHRPEFIDRAEKAVPCQWEQIDLTTIEIVLPPWADETGPKARTKIASKPQADQAADRERDRRAHEQREAEQRRQARDLVDLEAEALRQVQQAMAAAKEAFRADLGLTKTEGEILQVLIGRINLVVSRESLMTLLYLHKADSPPDEKIIDVLISKVRPKLPAGCEIRTHHGQGWQFVGNPSLLFQREAA